MLSYDEFSRDLDLATTGHAQQLENLSFFTLGFTADLTPSTVNPQFFIGAGYLYGQTKVTESWYSYSYAYYYYYSQYHEKSDKQKINGLIPLAGLNIKLGEHLKLTTLLRWVNKIELLEDMKGNSSKKVSFSYGLGIDF
jgi:hypothetical protein